MFKMSNYNKIMGNEAGVFVTEKPVDGYKKIECTCKQNTFTIARRLHNYLKGSYRTDQQNIPQKAIFIAKIEVPTNATIVRPNTTTNNYTGETTKNVSNKLRTDIYKIKEILPHKKGYVPDKCYSIRNNSYEYVVNKTYSIDNLNKNIDNECSSRGLYFFLKQSEAVDYFM